MRRFLVCIFVSTAALAAQSSSVTTSTATDINGNTVQNGPEIIQTKTPTGSETTVTRQSINGRMVPVEKVEVNILKDDASGRIVERIVRRFDPNGNPAPPEKETIEEQKSPNGSSTIQTSTYRGDINGNLQLAQKLITEVHKSEGQETAETVIQKPTINGSLDTVEKQSQVKVLDSSGGYRQDATTYRANPNGGFYEAVRTTTEHAVQGSEVTDHTAEYEVDSGGQLQLHSQTVSKAVTAPDGSKEVVVDIFGNNVPGVVNSGSSALKLQEQQVSHEKPGPNDTVTQTLSVRRPSMSDPNTLGPAQQLSQTVCQGACKP
jgi:hypothetical protein